MKMNREQYINKWNKDELDNKGIIEENEENNE